MRKTKAFTLIELLVVISIIALLIGILLPALAAARRTARMMKNTTQVRGIHQALVIFAQSNNFFYPGMNRDGVIVDQFGDPGPNGALPGVRFQLLLEDDYFTSDYCISPSESKIAWTAGTAQTTNYSYSLLNLVNANINSGQHWKADEDGDYCVVSDRPIINGTDVTPSPIRSVHNNPEVNTTNWKGSVAYNDGHSILESSVPIAENDLFDAANDFLDPQMVYSDSVSAL